MTTNDLKWLQITLYVCNKLTEVIWDDLDSFKSWGDKISYTINMQRLVSFFCGVSETVYSQYNHSALVQLIAPNTNISSSFHFNFLQNQK